MNFLTFRRRSGVTVLAAIAVLMVAACGPGEPEPITTPAPVERPKVSVAPPAPMPEPERPVVPSGLATGLDRFETTGGTDFRLRRVVLTRPDMAGASPVRVAVLTPQEGTAAQVGRNLLAAAQLALFDAREPRLVLMPRASGDTPESAADAARAAIAEGAELIVGPLFGAQVPAVRDIAAAAGVPVLSFSNDISVAGNGVWTLGIDPRTEIGTVIGFAAARGHSRVAAFLPDSTYGDVVRGALLERAEALAVDVPRISLYPAGSEANDEALLQAARLFADYDLRKAALEKERAQLAARDDAISKAALKRLDTLDTLGDPPFDAVLLAEPAPRLPTIAPLLAFYDVDPSVVRLLGMGSWYATDLGKEPNLIGAWFPGPDPALFEAFATRFAQTFGHRPGRIATLGYDAIALVAALVRDSAGTPRPLTPAALESPDGFSAYYGTFRLLADGRTQRLLPVLEVTQEGLRVVAPAPAGFTPLTN
ncbi:MAG: penicillin-binding protein activator [Pseudomonadota bacterium]|nr:penicillin-binding protein activator [Pseudomonadota bacterium]